MTLITDARDVPSPSSAGVPADVGDVVVDASVAAAEERAVANVARRITADVVGATEADVLVLLRACLEASRGAKVQNFRLVLAERETRARLRRR